MKRILVWDIPTRLFHWLLAAAFLGAFTIANVAGHRSSAFPLHMLLGLTVGFMVVLRVVWGFAGTRYARFGSFLYGPKAVLRYLRGTFTRSDERHIGHNPGSSWAIYGILVLALGMATTGLLMLSRVGGEALQEVHEVLAWTFFIVVVAHVAGVLWHLVRHRENIVKSMVDGHKAGEPDRAIRSARPLVALVFLVLVGLWSGSLFASYDSTARTFDVPVLGQYHLGHGGDQDHADQGSDDDDD